MSVTAINRCSCGAENSPEAKRCAACGEALNGAAERGVAPTEHVPLALDLTSPQLTFRAVLTGMVIGAVLSICNIYTSLQIGWSTNMSITGILLAYGLWHGISRISGGRVTPMGMLENNINQASCSAAAAVASAGLVAPIPAWTMLTGETLPWHWLALWVFAVCIVGITVATGLRKQMVVVDRLPFPSGIACAETLREIYSQGREALYRLSFIGASAVVACALKILKINHVPMSQPLNFKLRGFPASTFQIDLDLNVIMLAVGGLIGIRACVSIMLGAIVAHFILAPWVAEQGLVAETKTRTEWLIWPGVTLMVVASLVSFTFSWRSILRTFTGSGGSGTEEPNSEDVPRSWFIGGVAVALVLSVFVQSLLFPIAWWMAIIGSVLSFVLAVVATRVSGETNITPIGAMGKVTQLTFGAIDHANPAANLMTANVTGGAASQCADLMHDFKTGWLLGASPKKQYIGQLCGAAAGAMLGSWFYMILLPDPATQVGTKEWPAPAVIAWKVVAELFMKGFDALPKYTLEAMAIAAAFGVVLPVIEKFCPKALRWLTISAASAGLAFVIETRNAITMFSGGLFALAVTRMFPAFSARFLVTICAGLIVGESLTGAGDVIYNTILGALGKK